jgi:hypothetical protein
MKVTIDVDADIYRGIKVEAARRNQTRGHGLLADAYR